MGLTRNIKRYLNEHLDKRRYQHTLNVRRTARKLARRHLEFGSREERQSFLKKVSLAALLHDIDKQTDSAELWRRLKSDPEVKAEDLKASREVWHAFTAAMTARERFGILDPDILNAVRYHTTGRRGMSELEKIIYLADYIEPGRRFEGVEAIRRAAQQGLDEGVRAALEHSIAQLRTRDVRISHYTLEARKDITEHGNF